MSNKVLPLSYTVANWQGYTELCQEILGYSPTRGLDRAGLDVSSPASFLATLDLENDPLSNLASGINTNKSSSHVSCGFIFAGSQNLAVEILSHTHLDLIIKGADYEKLIIASGTMCAWHHAVTRCCKEDSSKDCKRVFGEILQYFRATGFGPLWSSQKGLMR